MDKATICKDLQLRMENTIKNFIERDLKGLRTGRASVNLLDPVLVKVCNDKISLSEVASITTPDARTITVQVWDKSMIKDVEKAIIDANLGLNPISSDKLIRINIPLLNEERRKELVKLAQRYGEAAKVALRNIRKYGNEKLKKIEKDIAKDEYHRILDAIQKLTDEFIKKVDSHIVMKEKEVLTV